MIKSGSWCSVLSKVWRGIMGCVVLNQKVTSYFQSLSLFLSRQVCFYASFSITDCWFFCSVDSFDPFICQSVITYTCIQF